VASSHLQEPGLDLAASARSYLTLTVPVSPQRVMALRPAKQPLIGGSRSRPAIPALPLVRRSIVDLTYVNEMIH
jgi:hypothetical protein